MTNERYAQIRASVAKPVMSNNFTIDDIHKIREWNYEITKGLTKSEKSDFYAKRSEEALKFYNKRKEV